MYKVYKDPTTHKLYVRAKVTGAGEMQHTFPCRSAWQCPICSNMPQTNIRRYAEEIGRKFETELYEKRQCSRVKSSSLKSRITLIKHVLERYKEGKRNGGLGNEKATYERLYDDLGRYHIDSAWSELSDFVAKMQKSVSPSTKKPFRPKSINLHISMLKGAVTYCYDQRDEHNRHLLPENYLAKFPMLKVENIEYYILSNDQVPVFWNNITDRIRPYVLFSWLVPIREGEAINLKREHVDIWNHKISLPWEMTKEKKIREIMIPIEMEDYFRRFIASPAEFVFNRGPDESYLPLGYPDKSKGGRISWTMDLEWWRGVEAATNERKYNVHKMRQQAVMNLVQLGKSKDYIRQYGGWTLNPRSDAFMHYFNENMAMAIMEGRISLDLSHIKTFAEQLRRAA